MRRLHALLVTNPDCEADRAEHMLEKMGHLLVEVYDAAGAIQRILEYGGLANHFDVVIIDGFTIGEAEMVACEIRMSCEEIYIGIMSAEAKHREQNGYADEVIPETFMALRDALEHRFSSGAI